MKKTGLSFLIVAQLLTFCKSPDMKSIVKNKLTEKYGEEFVVFYDSYNYVLGTYQFQAAPIKNRKLVFVGSHNNDLSIYTDNYQTKYSSNEFTKYVKAEVEKYSRPAYLFCRLSVPESEDNTGIDVYSFNLESALDTVQSLSFRIICYFFKELSEQTKEELLTGIYNIIEPYKKHPDAIIAVNLKFWAPDFLNLHSLDYFEFDRRKSSSPTIKLDDRKYVTQMLDLYLSTNVPFIDFNIDTLFKYSQAVTPDSFGTIPTNLNEMAGY